MANSRRYLKSKGTASPAPKSPSIGPSQKPVPLSEDGLLSFAELAIGALIIAFLLVTAINTLKVTEKGTVGQKKQQQALDLAKARSEELKSYMSGLSWNNEKVDLRFPPTQTPAVGIYNSYAPTTVTLGSNTFILDPEVRYMYSDATSQLIFVPTPGTAATPEMSNLIRIRVDAYYGPLAAFVPLPTAEAQGVTQNRMVYANFLANKVINVGAPGMVWGYVYDSCGSSGVGGVEVGLYQGASEAYKAITDSTGYFFFNSVPADTYNLQIVSSPGYDFWSNCNFTNPVTVTAGGTLGNQQIGVKQIPNWAYWGYVVQTTPVVNSIPPTPPVPTPANFGTATPAPVANALVYVNDGNSKVVTSAANGGYTITQIRSTPVNVATHTYDTVEADDYAATLFGFNYNVGSNMYLPNQVIGGTTYIGPITVYLQNNTASTIPVTFVVLDETGSTLSGTDYTITVNVADGSLTPPSGTLPNPGTNSVTLNVHPGAPQVSVNISNNTSPPNWIAFNQSLQLDATTNTQPITLTNIAIGTVSGAVSGLGVFDYTQFQVVAQDDGGQYIYSIPVTWDGVSGYGGFSYAYLRTPLGADSGDLIYNFSINGAGDYTSTTERMDARQRHANVLNNPILITPLNVYASVTVTQHGSPYAAGAWISAQMAPSGSTPASGPPTTGMGYGFSVSNYFSTVTKGDGTGLLQIQLIGGAGTTYVFSAQIVDPTTFATSTKSQTITMPTSATFASPMGVSFGF